MMIEYMERMHGIMVDTIIILDDECDLDDGMADQLYAGLRGWV